MAKYTDTVAGHAGVALLMSPAVQLIPKWHNGLCKVCSSVSVCFTDV